jgi:hypothetical protein
VMGERAFLLLANLMLLARARILATRPFGATYVVIPLATTVVGLTKRADETRGCIGKHLSASAVLTMPPRSVQRGM